MTVRDFDPRNSQDRARVLKQTEEQRQNGTYEWSCGHKAGAMCLECWSELARKANKLVEELDAAREEIDRLRSVEAIIRADADIAISTLRAIAAGADEAGQIAVEALRRIAKQ